MMAETMVGKKVDQMADRLVFHLVEQKVLRTAATLVDLLVNSLVV